MFEYELKVDLGEQYVDNPMLSTVIFLVEDRRFYAHRIFLLGSSDTFRATFDGARTTNAEGKHIYNQCYSSQNLYSHNIRKQGRKR
ncbi:ARM REPEAT PROTEIN INTERACTING WITH ABF2-like [Pyrus x bretschneideri]|uniref:ARM REPEAT PROTEIN INTERACTING WITH ABF2-like n=1 Tax=Pyrus x bretschneideri TaxID=225117 RepID=UPI0020308CE9|nr:ARM REPEAT PROTEIN INTERACTING WITH ABF2-like [Pyrus x bretschneideri]